jgi:hypothetical protein
MAGFRTTDFDVIDAALQNWAIWATQSSGIRTESDGGGSGGHDTDGTKREAHHETREVCQVGWAMDVDAELVEVQAQIDARLRFNSWNVRDTVRRWYHGTGTDEYEAESLGIPRSTFSDRIDQVKRRVIENRDQHRSNELSNKLRTVMQ